MMTRPATRRARIVGSVAVLWTIGLELLACGGTTGRSDLLGSSNGGASGDAAAVLAVDAGVEPGVDATVDADAEEPGFDATIVYADADRLPHVDLDAGMGQGDAPPPWASWPVCAPDIIQLDPTLGINVGGAPDSGACSPDQVVWTLRPECDRCYRYNGSLEQGPVLGQPFPPCSDLRDAGRAAAGSRAGTPLFDLCADLYTCALGTGCWSHGVDVAAAARPACYCGDASVDDCNVGKGSGLCKSQYEAAFQVIPNSVNQGPKWAIASAYAYGDTTGASYAGAEVMTMLHNMTNPTLNPPALSQCDWACDPQPADAGPPQPSVMLDGHSFTKTESLLYAANPSCYACLKEVGCLDDTRGDVNHECEDLGAQTVPAAAEAGAGQLRQELCYATVQCILGSQSCLSDFASFFPSNRCFNDVDAGGCLTQEQNGLETSNQASMTNAFNDPTRGAGMANQIFNCAVDLDCPTCFPQ